MELGGRVTRAGILSLTNVSAPFGRSPPLGGSFVASQLGGSTITGGKLKEVSGVRGIVQVTVLIAEVFVGFWDGCEMIER